MAYRDGFVDSMTLQPVAWKMATPSPTGTTDIMVTGAYSVAVVCDLDANTTLTWQGFHDVDDDIPAKGQPPTVITGCQPKPVLHTVSGKMVHGGVAQLGDAVTSTLNAGDTASFSVPDGTYDLVAAQTDASTPAMNKVLIRRDIVVAGADVTLPDIDTATGFALVAITPELDNPPPPPDPDDPDANTEVVTAQVAIQTKNNASSSFVSSAVFNLDTRDTANHTATNKDKKVTLYAIPDDMLAADDVQNVIFAGHNNVPKTNKATDRSILKPLGKVTSDTAIGKATAGFSLPAGITIPGWGMDKSRLSVALPALPALDDLTLEAQQQGTATKKPRYVINITASYFAKTTLARPVFDTDIPNFPADGKIDFTQPYERTIRSQRDAFTKGVFVDHEESQFAEQQPPPPPAP